MNNELLIVGMSPGNSYFRQEVITKLLKFAVQEYKNIEIFIPDIPAIATYVALGYPENIARREKAIPQGNAFRNRIRKAIDQENININNISIFDWKKENIENNPEYKNQYDYLKNLYIKNDDFKKDINEATSQVLFDNPFKKKTITESDIEIGTHYIISEFAFMLFLPFYKKEYSSFIYGYHKPWPVWEKFIDGFYDGILKSNLKFIQLPDFSN